MTEKSKAELEIALNVLAIWEETYAQLPHESRQVFLDAPLLTRLVNVSDDTLRHAISKFNQLVDIVPYALAVQVETFRRELARYTNLNQERELAAAREEIQNLKQELYRLRGADPVVEALLKHLEKLKSERAGTAPERSAVERAKAAREQHFERLSLQQQRKIDSLEKNLARYKLSNKSLREECDKSNQARVQLEALLKQQISTSATEQHIKTRAADSRDANEKARSSKLSPTDSKRNQQNSEAKRSSLAGVAHKASGFSGKPRQMAPEFDDTELCTQCGARISASSAALHDCS